MIKSVVDKFANCEYLWQIIPDIKKLVAVVPSDYTEIKKDVFIGKNVKIAPTAYIEAPTVIGDGTEIRHSAYIRGNVIIGDNCVVGNSTEIKNSILFDNVSAPHYNYIGDSVIGKGSHLGAGVICSNLRSDKKTVVVHDADDIDTGLRKFGAIIKENVEIGCGCVLNPGTVIGKNTTVYPLTSLRGVYPDNSIVKDTFNVVERKEI